MQIREPKVCSSSDAPMQHHTRPCKNSGKYISVTNKPVWNSIDHDTMIAATTQSTLANTQTLPSAACVACQDWLHHAPQALQGGAKPSQGPRPTPRALKVVVGPATRQECHRRAHSTQHRSSANRAMELRDLVSPTWSRYPPRPTLIGTMAAPRPSCEQARP